MDIILQWLLIVVIYVVESFMAAAIGMYEWRLARTVPAAILVGCVVVFIVHLSNPQNSWPIYKFIVPALFAGFVASDLVFWQLGSGLHPRVPVGWPRG